MTLTALIEGELLNVVDQRGGFEEVMRRHATSKGPLYRALFSATAEMGRRLEQANLEKTEAEARGHDLQECVDPLQERRERLLEEVQELEGRYSDAEAQLTRVESTVDRAQQLGKQGFGERELDRLAELLTQIAASQGLAPEQGAAEFFRFVGRFEQIISLDLEATRAEARAAQAKAQGDRWIAEAQSREVHSKARSSSIEVVENLLDKGVKADDLVQWTRILEQTGVTAEELTASLDQYGSLEVLAKARQERADELQVEVSGLESRVTALSQERDNLAVAIQAVQDQGLRQVKKAGIQVTKLLDSLVQEAAEVGRLRAEAAELGSWVKAARLLGSGDRNSWKQLPIEIIEHYLFVILTWVQGEGRDLNVSPPGSIGRVNPLFRHTSVKLSQILHWALSGLWLQADPKPKLARR